MRRLSVLIISVLFPAMLYAAPVLLFQDITSGPKTGGDSYGGAIITIWGTGLGTSQGSSKVYVGGVESDHVYYWGTSDGGASGGGPADLTKLNIQEISFSVPATAADGAGTIYVTVGGVNSNTLAFTVRTGNIYFVGNTVTGSGTYASPWSSPTSFFDVVVAGDICYFVGTKTYSGYYVSTYHETNFLIRDDDSQPNGTAANPIAMIVYPGGTTTLSCEYSNIEVYRDYWAFSKFTCVSSPHYSCVLEGGTESRYIGMKLTVPDPVQEGIAEFGTDIGPVRFYGNELTGITNGDKMSHAIYLNGCPTDVMDVGWNYIHDNNIARGPLIQINHEPATYNNGDDCVGSADHYIHDNYIDATTHPSRGIGVYDQGYETHESSSRQPSAYIYNNVLVNCGLYEDGDYHASIYILNGHCYIYNNTIYNSGGWGIRLETGVYGPLLSSEIRNNIIYMRSSSPAPNAYISYESGQPESEYHCTNNLYYGFTGHDSYDSAYVEGNPLFTTAGSDFSLQATSPAKDAGTSTGTGLTTYVLKDFIGTTRPVNSIYDIGAYEYTTGEASITRALINGTIRNGTFHP